ncbi:CDP-glucose 4,6-dehydratase [soil metagenome]|nr:CDP-glucose 4,6-dehydratase [Gemmatimonadota bacterium]
MIEQIFGGAYRGRRVLVTGHTGFKGSWLSLWLARLGAEVHGYALQAPTEPALFNEADVEGCLASHCVGDVRDSAALAARIRAIEPEVVFHLAAQPLVRRSYSEPRETYDVNVMGTVNLLEAVRAAESVRVCQVVTSDKCYENREWVYAYRESDPMGGYDPYSSSKGCAELVTAAYRRSFFSQRLGDEAPVSLSTVRAGNVIGGGDWAEDRIIPDCIRALEIGKTIPVRNPDAVRPWQHVLEPLSGYLHLAASQSHKPVVFADAWNFGPDGAGNLPVRELVELLVTQWGSGASWEDLSPAVSDAARDRLHEATFLKLDITKSQSLLGWRPVLSVPGAIQLTVEWYRTRGEQTRSSRVRDLCLQQIEDYVELAARSGQIWAGAGTAPEVGYARC